MKLKYDLALWKEHSSGHTYGFPLGVKDSEGRDILPAIDFDRWTYRGTVPASTPVSDRRADQGNRIVLRLSGVLDVYTADWAVGP